MSVPPVAANFSSRNLRRYGSKSTQPVNERQTLQRSAVHNVHLCKAGTATFGQSPELRESPIFYSLIARYRVFATKATPFPGGMAACFADAPDPTFTGAPSGSACWTRLSLHR